MGEQDATGKAEPELDIEEAGKNYEIAKALVEFEDTRKAFCLECGFNPNEVVLKLEPLSTKPSVKIGILKLGGDMHKAMKTERQLNPGDDMCAYKDAVLFFNEFICISMRAVDGLEEELNKCFGEEKVRGKGYLEGLGLYVEAFSEGVMISARKKDSEGSFKTFCSVEGETLTKALEKLSSSECWNA